MTSGKTRIWAVTAALAAIEAILLLTFLPEGAPAGAPFELPWWALALAFFSAEVFVIYLEFRREAYHFSLSELVIVFGLFFASPLSIVVGQIVGAAGGLLLYRRQSPLKAFFNIAHFSLGAAVATIVFRSLAPHDLISVGGWGATFVATITGVLLSLVMISLAISLSQGTGAGRALSHGLGTGLVIATTNTSLGLMGVTLAWFQPWALLLLLVPVATLFVAYRAYTNERQQHRSMESLLRATRIMQRSLQIDAAVSNLLSETREMFLGERAEVYLFHEGATTAELALLDGDNPVSWTESVVLDPSKGVWARSAAEGSAVLVKRPIENARLRAHFDELGVRDCMVAPFKMGDDVFGFLQVSNRLGDVSTFDDEDLQLLETIVNHASAAIHNARLVSQLETSLEHLKEMNQLKDDFVASVSHELRTPLTSIQGYVKTLLRKHDAFAPDLRQSFLETVDKQSDRLRVLIEDLLIVSRLEAHQVRAVNKPFVVMEVVNEVLEETDLGDREVAMNPQSPLPVVTGDREKVRQIVSNLVENALKYTPEGSPISIRVRSEGSGIEIDVEDEGPGIPLEMQEKIFDRFFQVDQTSTRAAGGAGLGLFICRRLADIIGGRLWLSRSNPAGSVFSLWIPVSMDIEVEQKV